MTSPKSKSNKKTTEMAELVPAGALSKALETSLKEAGKAISDDDIRSAFSEVEIRRGAFQKCAIMCGIMLLAKKRTIRSGQWKNYLEVLFKSATAVHFSRIRWGPPGESYRTAANYMALGKRFLSKLEDGGFARELDWGGRDMPAIEPSALVIMNSLPADQRRMVDTALDGFIDGRSLRRMLQDFRQAEKDADADEADAAPPEAAPEAGPKEYRECIRGDARNSFHSLTLLLFDGPFSHYLEPDDWREILDAALNLSSKIRKILP